MYQKSCDLGSWCVPKALACLQNTQLKMESIITDFKSELKSSQRFPILVPCTFTHTKTRFILAQYFGASCCSPPPLITCEARERGLDRGHTQEKTITTKCNPKSHKTGSWEEKRSEME